MLGRPHDERTAVAGRSRLDAADRTARRGAETLHVRARAAHALADGALPDELPAAALWWRLTQTLPAGWDQVQSPGPAPAVAPPLATASTTAADRWKPVVDGIDPRLSSCPAWPALAAALDRAQQTGYDVATHLPRLAADGPLPDSYPTRSLHYRVVGECDAAITPAPTTARATCRSHDERASDAARLAPAAWPVHSLGSTGDQRTVHRAALPTRDRGR